MSATNDVDPRTAKSCGPDAPTLVSSWRRCFASRWRRWQESPVTGESTKETVKTIAQGRPGISGEPVVTMLVCFFNSHARLRVQRAPGFPCALYFSGARLANLGRIVSREWGGVSGAPRRSNLPPCLYSSYPAKAGYPVRRAVSASTAVSGILGHPLSRVTTAQTRSTRLTIFWHCGLAHFSFRTGLEACSRQPTVNGFAPG